MQRALSDARLVHPTEIQSRAIPKALDGLDVLGCAQTGTGKTAAFVLPILDYLSDQRIKAAAGKPAVLILAPTRELAIQIEKTIDVCSKYLPIRSSVIYGGVNQSSQVRSLQRGVDIVVATPGRLLDLMQQGHVDFGQLEIFVLDEADRMLDMGFLPDLKRIIRGLPEDRQSLFFSATLAPKISQFAKSLLYKPVVIDVTPKSRSVDKIEQQMVLVAQSEKQHRLHAILTKQPIGLALVFTRTKRSANKVERNLKQRGIEAGAIHGNKSQSNRERTLEAFRQGRIQVLVATDVAARGIDVSDVSHVVNYDLPADPESYLHRVGRTGRAGADGTAITFYTSEQRQELRAIEQFAGIRSDAPKASQERSGSRRGKKRWSGKGSQQAKRPQRNKPSSARSCAQAT